MSDMQWIVELSNGTDDPDYYGPFLDKEAARTWRSERDWASERECVLIRVHPPGSGEDDYNVIIPLTRDEG